MDVIDREIEKCLRQIPHFQNITISARALESGVVKTGSNHCSEIFRFTINYEKGGHKYVKSFFVKAPYSLRHYEDLKEFQFFAKEIYMYNVVFPLFKFLLPNQSLQPEFYGTDGREALILEDLSYSGYKLMDHRQMDFEHSVVAFKLLAKFHALSVKIHEIKPTILDTVRNETFLTTDYVRHRACYCHLFNSRFEKVVRRAAASYAGQHPEVLHLLKNDNSLLQTVVQELRCEKYSFYVLNHGDFHTNNIMFEYDELGQIKNAKCLDFQSCRWSSPAIDIIYLSITSVHPQVFEQHFHLLLETYVQTLNATLKYLKCDQRLEIEALRRDMAKIKAYWLHTLMVVFPLIVSNLQNCVDHPMADEFLDNEYYIELTKFWLPHLIEKGVFSKYEKATTSINQFSNRFKVGSQLYPLKNEDCQFNKKTNDRVLSGSVLLQFNSQSSICIKIPLPSDHSELMKMGTDREIFMYEKVLPKLFELYNGKRYAPLCHAITENHGLILEDLEAQGYRACDCKKQLDLDHCRVALTTLAKYHALSAKYIENSNQVLVDALTQMPDYGPSLMTFCNNLYGRFLVLTKTLTSTMAYQKLCGYEEELEKKWVSISGTCEVCNGFSVIAQGNFCTYNILFKYDERGRVHDAKMVNWQMSRRALPVLDLVYFFVGSVQFEVFNAHRDTLLNLYVDTLNETLSKIQCSCTYSRADLDRHLNEYRILFPLFASCILQIIMTGNDPLGFSFQQNNELTLDNYLSAVAKWLNYFVENRII